MLSGGAGADTFSFETGDGVDTITDFEIASDVLQIDGATIVPLNLPTGVVATEDGTDVILSYGAADTIRIANSILSDWVVVDTPTGTAGADSLMGGAANDTISGLVGDDTIYGNDGDDVLAGDSNEDLIFGGAGNDIITGGSHYDTIEGGAGDDQVWGDNGRDLVTLGDGNDVFNDNTQTGTHSHDTVNGGEGNDTINGGGGDDVFSGDAGDDAITGGGNNDTLTGGEGADTFFFTTGDDTDVITDFDIAMDVIDIDGVVLTAGALPGDVVATEDGADVLLSYGSGDTIRLEGGDLSDWLTPQMLGTAGTITTDQTGPNQWHTVSFGGTITDAVVVMGPVSTEDGDPLTTRVRNVTEDGFEFQFDEYEYQDGIHGTETVSWLAVSEGTHTLANGLTLVADTSMVGTTNVPITFGQNLTDAVVLHQVSSTNDADAVTSRILNVDADGFEAALREQEQETSHVAEELSWIAIESGQGGGIEVVRTPDQVSHTADTFTFNEVFASAPLLLGNLQTLDGAYTSTLRRDGLSNADFSAYVDEEQSRDSEINHTNEVIGWVALNDGFMF